MFSKISVISLNILFLITGTPLCDSIITLPSNEDRNEDVNLCYNLTEIFSQMLGSYELFANQPQKIMLKDFPQLFGNQSRTTISGVKISGKPKLMMKFIYTNHLMIQMSFGNSLNISGHFTKLPSCESDFTYTYRNLLFKIEKKTGNDTTWRFTPENTKFGKDIEWPRGCDKETMENPSDINNFKTNFEDFAISKLKKKFDDLDKSSYYKNMTSMFMSPIRQSICMKSVQRKPAENSLMQYFYKVSSNNKGYVNITSISIDKLGKIGSFLFYNDIKESDLKMLDKCDHLDDNRIYDCQTFLMFHNFELEIKSLEGQLKWCMTNYYASKVQQSSQCDDLEFIIDKAKIFGKATMSRIEISRVKFLDDSCTSGSPKCDAYRSNQIIRNFLLHALEKKIVSVVKEMFAPLQLNI